jgi:hypothetical protein
LSLVSSSFSPGGLGCPGFEHYPRRIGISITTKYLITNNTKRFIKQNNNIIIIYYSATFANNKNIRKL